MTWMNGFEQRSFDLPDSVAVARVGGNPNGPALVLLHGFPQTHVMWHRVAQTLAKQFFIVMPDLRGYGGSALKPGIPELPDHSQHSKRAMAKDVLDVVTQLGIDRFFLCGHDRGGRVAHRLSVDWPTRVKALCVIDICPTLDMYARTDMDFARAYYHWFHLIQPAPLPENMIGDNRLAYLHNKLGGWGTGGMAHIEPEALAEYERCFCRPEAVHRACEDYRASATIDLDHDRASRAHNDKIVCNTLVLWGERGVIHRMFNPVALWQAQCSARVTGETMPAGHFIPEELPETTAWALSDFFVGPPAAKT